MFRVIAIDDEELELEAMKALVNWESADATLIATAKNGEEGLEKILSLKPDIVITDISMPKLDGISMIEKARELQSDAVFVILSGYGEFEYTSRAMENGIKHYILKPINEEKVLSALQKAEADKTKLVENAKEKEDKEKTIETFEPSARRGFFLSALKGSMDNQEWLFYKEHLKIEQIKGLFAFTIGGSTNENAEEEFLAFSANLLSDISPLYAVYKGIFYFLIDQSDIETLEKEARKIRQYALDQGFRDIRFAFSSTLVLKDAKTDVIGLLSTKWKEGNLVANKTSISGKEMEGLLMKDRWKNIKTHEDLYYYSSLLDLEMASKEYSDTMREKALYAFSLMTGVQYEEECDREEIFSLVEKAYLKNQEESIDEKRWREIIRFLYLSLSSQTFSLKTIASDAAYMSEDYFSRYFQKMSGEKFSRYLTKERMQTAIDILAFNPFIQINELTNLCGYQENGQYFQKVFKETFNDTVSNIRSRFFKES